MRFSQNGRHGNRLQSRWIRWRRLSLAFEGRLSFVFFLPLILGDSDKSVHPEPLGSRESLC